MYYDELTRRGGMGGMIFGAMGGIMCIITCFMWIYIRGGAYGNYGEGLIPLSDILEVSNNYVYLWFVPVGGIIAVVLGAIAYAIQKKPVAYVVPVIGIIVLVLPIYWAIQFSDDMMGLMSVVDVFYYSVNVMGISITWLFLGAIFCWIAAGLILAGGAFLISGINPEYISKNSPKLDEAIKAKQEADPEYVNKEEVEKVRQERIATKEQEEEEKRQAIEEREYSTTCWVEIEAPASVTINGTGTVTATVMNESEEVVKTIEFDFGDLEYYFNVQGSLKFTNVAPGQEITGSVKIKPKKEEEGIYPILIEIKLDKETIERRLSIRVEGQDSY